MPAWLAIICKCRERERGYQIGIIPNIRKSRNGSNHVFLTTFNL